MSVIRGVWSVAGTTTLNRECVGAYTYVLSFLIHVLVDKNNFKCLFSFFLSFFFWFTNEFHGRDRMIARFISTYTISAYHC